MKRRILALGLSVVGLGLLLCLTRGIPGNPKALEPSRGIQATATQPDASPQAGRAAFPPTTVGASPERPKAVSEMSVAERNRLAQELKSLAAPALANEVFALLRSKGDPGRLDLAWRLLVPKLQTELVESDKTRLYSEIQSLLTGATLTAPEKSPLVQMLGRTATPEALSMLIALAQQDSLGELRPLITKMIGAAGDYQWGDKFHVELSPVLEKAWAGADKTPGLQESLAEAIAGVGARSGIELLYAEALRGGRTVADFSAQEDNMAWHVADVFRKIRNPDAVPILASGLGDQPFEDLSLVLSGASLAAMGCPEATGALLHWAEASKREVGPLLEPWLAEARDPDSLALLEQKVADPSHFANPENWKAADRALRDWQSRRSVTTSEN